MNATARFPRRTLLALATALTLGTAGAAIEDNPEFRDAYQGWNAALLLVLPSSFLPGPFGTAADLASIAFDLRLKFLEPTLVAPTPTPRYPNADLNGVAADSTSQPLCEYHTKLDEEHPLGQVEDSYQNILGLFGFGLADDWGPFGTPEVGHNNAEVAVRVTSPFLTPRAEGTECPLLELPERAPEPAGEFPSGNHRLTWSATTQLDPFFDLLIPAVLFVVTSELKYGEAITSTEPGSARRAQAIGKEVLKNLAIEAGVVGGGLLNPVSCDSARHEQTRTFRVYDVNPPVVRFVDDPANALADADPPPFEAIDFGGIRFERIRDELAAAVEAFDPCGAPFLFGNDAPVVLPLNTAPDGQPGGRTPLTWTATDSGPLPPDGSNPGVARLVQNIRVEDTRAPILLPPPNRVIEAEAPASTPRDFDVGTAVTFDLADPDVEIVNDVPAAFPVDSRTAIAWTAVDDSGNVAVKSQWVTVKAPGTNTPPTVEDVAAATLTGEPVDLVLSGSDGDFLDGAFDPLNFDIVSQPANGFFVAPLVPYFIEDYRVRPGDDVGDIINFSNNPAGDLNDQVCRQGGEIPIDFVYEPLFVQVLDDGTSFVRDHFWRCGPSDATTSPRISKWGPTGEFITQRTDIDDDTEAFTLDRDGFLYLVTPATNSSDLSLRKFDQNLEQPPEMGQRIWFLDPPTDFGQPAGRLLNARIDSDTGIIYATDRARLFAYDGADGQQEPAYLGAFLDGASFMGQQSIAGSSSLGYQIEIDRQGFVYVVGSTFDRIHQFGPSTRAGGGVTLGHYVGWLGRCDSGPNCDDENQRSIGYSCTEATCMVIEADGTNCGPFTSGPCTFGSDPGQFDTPVGIALDAEDTLYVTDYENFRVQRFTPLGDFAGEAKSECDGTCFVLGDMGRPLDVTVNATQFFVLDRDRDLMHVFETAPFKDITEDSVVVSYASDNDFQGTDTFTFRAGDGLAFSDVATATIDVTRAFRPPVALAQTVQVIEDGSVAITLAGDDPDGIAGVDFNGLDTLTFELVDGPANGSLSGTPPELVYTPDPDVNGPDALSFRVSDGVFTSAPAVVAISVTAVNDVPQPRFTARESKLLPKGLQKLLAGKAVGVEMEAGLGFPVPLFVELEDPDVGESHTAVIDWGDGITETASTRSGVPQAGDEGLVITNTFAGLGQLVGEHVYLSTGTKIVEVCIFDAIGSGECTDAPVSVVPMVDMVISDVTDRPEERDLPLPGDTVTLALDVVNAAPEQSVSGETATGVVFEATVPEGTTVANLQTDTGACGELDGRIRCELGTLAAGTRAAIDLTLLTDPAFDPDEGRVRADVVADQADPNDPNAVSIELPLKAQWVFDDGFEGD